MLKIITALPVEKMQQVSARTLIFQSNVKTPLMLLILGASLQSGFTVVMLKTIDTFV